MNRDTTCLLCGHADGRDVKIGLISWKVPIGTSKYTAAPRCTDRLACRGRVELIGDQWDVEDPVIPTIELVGR